MRKTDHLDDYSLVGVDQAVSIPPRSVLASLRPRGLGTPYLESLSSYYLELAHIHHLSPKTLAREIIIPRIKIGDARRKGETSTIWRMPLFNGIGSVPETWAKHLSELTGQQELINLTLVPLRPYTNMQRLMSGTRKWCPVCFSEAAQEGRAYGQLLWEIEAVKACPKHNIRLISQCKCNGSAPLPPLKVKHLSGLCGSCGQSLAQNYESYIESASEDELKRARLVAELLGDTEVLKRESERATDGISMFLQGAVRHFTGGNAALFGQLFGVKKNTLHGWMHGKRIPNFPQMVEIALACRCAIADIMLGAQVMFGEPEIINAHRKPQTPSRSKTRKLDREMIQCQLEMLANEQPPISVAAAAVRIGVNRRTLFRVFGDIAKKMTRNFRAHRHYEAARNFANKCDLFRQSAVKLLWQGIRPTRRLVGLDIKGKGTVNKGAEQVVCSRICREVVQRGLCCQYRSFYSHCH